MAPLHTRAASLGKAAALAGAYACLTVPALIACGSQAGAPAAPYALELFSTDAAVTSVMDAGPPPPPNVPLAGRVQRAGSDAGVRGAIVVIEVGGLDRAAPAEAGPDGGAVATLAADPFIRFGAVTDEAGAFLFSVPAGLTGLHTLSPAYSEGSQAVTASASDAAVGEAVVSLVPLPGNDGGIRPRAIIRPVATGLSANLAPEQSAFAPLNAITFAVQVSAGTPYDPLSGDVFLLQPDTGWAGALAPPTPAVPGEPYPDGVYNRVVEAPGTPGVYTYTVVAASMGKITSKPVSILVTVTADGLAPIPDAGSRDASVNLSGLPDGRS